MVYEVIDTERVAHLFGKWEETLIWSCLQGIMGKLYSDHPKEPTAAMAVLGDFTFFAGEPNLKLISFRPDCCISGFRIIVPQNRRWQTRIMQFYGDRANVISRYAIKKEPDIFDREKLEQAVAMLPEQYRLSMIDERLYGMCKAEAWSRDLVSQFLDYKQYCSLGLGAVICEKDRIISGASSYSRYREGIEIEVDTRPGNRRKGFAYICAAKLILECLKKNLYPSWDAHNKGSVSLAEKLGYHYSHAYAAIEIQD